LFIKNWSDHWETPQNKEETTETGTRWDDKRLISSWLLDETDTLSPLEWTIKTWAAHAKAAVGSDRRALFDSYLNLVCETHKFNNLENFAEELLAKHNSSISTGKARSLLGEELFARLLSHGLLIRFQNDQVAASNPVMIGIFGKPVMEFSDRQDLIQR